ncbi:MAG: response regulator [Desulfacinum sp.]|jgi:CheY-like chemotaxis protein|nr:response regulator [Desulfacinum sp.]MBZ4658785.1 Blue-light-activated protein [Desulfacinum sp.]
MIKRNLKDSPHGPILVVETGPAFDPATWRILHEECGPALKGPVRTSSEIKRALEEFHPELLLVDAPPGWNPSALRASLGDESGPSPPLVLLGCPEDAGFPEKVLESGAEGWVFKPPRPREVTLVAEHIRRRRNALSLALNRMKIQGMSALAAAFAQNCTHALSHILDRVSRARAACTGQNVVGNLLGDAHRAAVEAESLLRGFLSLAGQGDLRPQPLDLSAAVQEVCAHLFQGPRAPTVDISVGCHLMRVLADRDALRTVLETVLQEMGSTPDRAGVVRIGLKNVRIPHGGPLWEVLSSGQYVRMELEGCGAEGRTGTRRTTFHPEAHTAPPGAHGGLNMEMFQALALVHAQGGHLDLKPRPGGGTVVTIYLPAAVSSQEPSRRGLRAPGPARARILAMDDEPMLRQLAEAVLNHLGYECDTAAHGQEALMLYKRALDAGRRYDMVVLDLTVKGGLGGIPTMAQLLAIDPQVKAVIYTGYSEDPIFQNYRLHGFKGAMRKPYSVKEMAVMVRRILGRSEH